MTILMTILSSEMVGFPLPRLPRFPRLFAAGYLPLVFHFLTPLSPLVRGPLPLKKRVMFMFCSPIFA